MGEFGKDPIKNGQVLGFLDGVILAELTEGEAFSYATYEVYVDEKGVHSGRYFQSLADAKQDFAKRCGIFLT